MKLDQYKNAVVTRIQVQTIEKGVKLAEVGSFLTKKIGLSSVRVYAQAQNVLMITKYKGLNPEMETLGVDLNGTPISRIVSFGINVGF